MKASRPATNDFALLKIPQTEQARRAYRELIVTTAGLSERISGVILYDETIRQRKRNGTPFIKAIGLGPWRSRSPGPSSNRRWRFGEAKTPTDWPHSEL